MMFASLSVPLDLKSPNHEKTFRDPHWADGKNERYSDLAKSRRLSANAPLRVSPCQPI